MGPQEIGRWGTGNVRVGTPACRWGPRLLNSEGVLLLTKSLGITRKDQILQVSWLPGG